MKNNKLPKLFKNNKGIETRVLIYVLGAVALVFAIMLIGQVNLKIEEVVNASMKQAKDIVNQNTQGGQTNTPAANNPSGSPPAATGLATGAECSSNSQCASGVCTGISADTNTGHCT